MSAGEFQLIERHLARLGAARDDVVLGVGDDAALIAPPPGAALAVASASVAPEDNPEAAAQACFEKAVRALRASGAEPAWLTLGLTLPAPDDDWVARFAQALDRACRGAGVSVVGGDTTAGPAAITVFLTGVSPP